jgi:hypothetical protein
MTQAQQHGIPESAAQPQPRFETCHECGAPLDRQQRYCVNCAARRSDIANPAGQYFAAATRSRKQATVRRTSDPKTSRAAAVGFFALLPIAVAIGVVVGRANGGNDNQAILDALRHQGTAVAAAPGAATTSSSGGGSASKLTSDQATGPVTTDFKLKDGYTVKIGTVPGNADAGGAAKAKQDAEKKGAKDVGVIVPSDFTIEPRQPGGAYILYSGQFKSKGDATKALASLKGKFKGAEVLHVQSTVDSTGAPVIAHTKFGEVHSVTNYKPPPAKIKKDTQIVNQIAHEGGANYLKTQQQLPDVISVGGDPSNAPPLPGGPQP